MKNKKMDVVVQPRARAAKPAVRLDQLETDVNPSNSDANPEWSDADERRQKLRKLLERQRQVEHQRYKPLRVAVIVAAVLVIGLSIVGAALYKQTQWLSSPSGITAQQQARAEALVAKVAALTSLPNERPVVSLIDDIDKLSSQRFFDGAKNGDVVLVYESTGRAIIYRETENRIIKDGPIVPLADDATVE
jgi:cytochrome c-type biogenesis protein CcmH/NrfG